MSDNQSILSYAEDMLIALLVHEDTPIWMWLLAFTAVDVAFLAWLVA